MKPMRPPANPNIDVLQAPPLARDLTRVSTAVVTLQEELACGAMSSVGQFELADIVVEVKKGRDSVWAILRRPGHGGIALRTAQVPAGRFSVRDVPPRQGEAFRCEIDSANGRQKLTFRTGGQELAVLRATVRLTPSAPLVIPFLQRDVYPLDADDDPTGAAGKVEAAQRGLNAGLLYFRIDEPEFGNIFYLQNLTAMNPYYRATRTKPDAAVGGEWPELGYLPPTPPQRGEPPVDPLAVGEEFIISDAILVFRDHAGKEEQDCAIEFLQMLGAAYHELDLPRVDYRDWVDRAKRTLRDLETSPDATLRHYGHLYVHPYTAAEYPDSMVQLSIIASLRDYAAWTGRPIPLQQELSKGLRKFYDPKLKTIRRYLPNVGKDKDADAIDSWYLYHALLNLGRLAIDDDGEAKRLFLDSIDFGIKAARHFRYMWPIQYKITDFSVITKARNEDGLGQTDVGGIYAYVMLLAYELTAEERFLHEARAAIDAARGMRFELNYQANLTAWGAAACMRLWRITTEEYYLRQSYVYLASFFHNTEIWESQIERAVHYRNFLASTCLHDAPYIAIYEAFDSFAAFERYLKDSGPDLEPAARMLIGEYCKYALDRAWYYYPDTLPKEILASEIRNGHIDPKLSFPLEDLYPDGQLAGQVGQEIYGAGAAFVFASRAFHTVQGAPFKMFCDHFMMASERTGDRTLTFQLAGGVGCTANLSLVRSKRRRLPKFRVTVGVGDVVRPRAKSTDRIDYHLPADARITISWDASNSKGQQR
jgi:hypothetical protein